MHSTTKKGYNEIEKTLNFLQNMFHTFFSKMNSFDAIAEQSQALSKKFFFFTISQFIANFINKYFYV